jgi:hypothetical protein
MIIFGGDTLGYYVYMFIAGEFYISSRFYIYDSNCTLLSTSTIFEKAIISSL